MFNRPKIVSPTRRYVAICNKSDFSGFYFRKFDLPEWDQGGGNNRLENNAQVAAWYFLNRLNSVACLEECCSWEDYQDIKNEDESRHPALR
jgi:hypothetical protein